ncbi:MAG: DUF2069 domain-containing protein [Neisseria sp.]|nr:DUF2069 domain-containing protein [Neisseria sp.]
MTPKNGGTTGPHLAAIISLLGLITLCLAWELWLAPLRAGGSWLAAKALPLCPAVGGVLQGRVYTFQWSCMLVLAYFAEGVMRLSDLSLAGRLCAAAAVLLSAAYFCACLLFVKRSRESDDGL